MKKYIANVKTKVGAWRSTDFHCIFLCQTPLFQLGLWFEEEGASGVGVAARSLMRGLLRYANAYTLFIGHPMLAYRSWGQDLHLAIEAISSAFVASLVFIQIHCLFYRRESSEGLFQTLLEMQRCADLLPLQPRSVLDQNRRWSERTLLYACASLVGLLVSFTSVPHLIATRSFMYRTWFPVEEQKSPYYEILFVLVFINHLQALLVLVFVSVMFMALLVQAIGHFRLLRCNLLDIFKTLPSTVPSVASNKFQNNDKFLSSHEGPQGVNSGSNAWTHGHQGRHLSKEVVQLRRETGESNALRTCIRHHHAILVFVNEIQSTFNVLLCQQLICILVPAGLGVILVIHADNIETRTITYIMMVLGGCVGVGLSCWLSDKLTEESELVRDAVFGCAWLSASEGFKRSMRIIMSRANQPVVIRVAGFIALSVETFYSVMKLTYSYFMASWTYFNDSVKQ